MSGYEFRAGAKAIQYSVNIVQNSLILSRFLKAGPSSSFEDRRRKESSTEFPNQHPKNFLKLYWNINTNEMSILRKKSQPTLDVFCLHMDGLFSIKIKVSYNAEIFLMRYRLIHDWLLILTPKEVTSF